MTSSKIVSAVLTFIVALSFSCTCKAGHPRLSPAMDGTLPRPLQVFVDRLAEHDLLHPRQYHSATDLAANHIHHRLTSYLFVDGHNYSPNLLYLGKDPQDSTKHLVVANFEPDEELLDQVRLSNSRKHEYAKRKGILAIKLVSHDEPEFVGILWHNDARSARRVRWHIDRNDLHNLESDKGIGLEAVQRVIYRRPI